ncbi:hypothetical protein B0T26DRAFT_682811 [Lasiosphaeria miniovina]|uniref:C2H2-type domain-containing protein n=1 Tax=Lasiosphaeria miniovina TaxID=1954250 RepID=A0AA40ED66_9PEZI|nr:uncharacterized protein B0T26DRAFT_682811 [Lasiosphaeria miniovina]KAK0733086.1 hypothetical protein B0T26DRAFT_682811 [Lasiosphaeria miniovina]
MEHTGSGMPPLTPLAMGPHDTSTFTVDDYSYPIDGSTQSIPKGETDGCFVDQTQTHFFVHSSQDGVINREPGSSYRKRRAPEEFERPYIYGWEDCDKRYGTFTHLNHHVEAKGHGKRRESKGEGSLPN